MISPYDLLVLIMKSRKSDIGREEQQNTSGLVQFRADAQLLKALSSMAERLKMPIGALARLWVAERLLSETIVDVDVLQNWINDRYSQIDKEPDLLVSGPRLTLHMCTCNRFVDLEPAFIRRFAGMLPPVERVDNFDTRINFEGFIATKVFANDSKPMGYVQVFRQGMLESVRVLTSDEQNGVFAQQIDQDIISAVWSYASALKAMEVPLPVVLFVRLSNLSGETLLSPRIPGYSLPFSNHTLHFPPVLISSWQQLSLIDSAAQTLRPTLDKLANAAGLSASVSFLPSGKWIVDESAASSQRTSSVSKKSSIPEIDLSGISGAEDRTRILTHAGGHTFCLGRVHPPYIKPSNRTLLRLTVLQKDLSPGAERFLRECAYRGDLFDIELGGQKLTGYVPEPPIEALSGGAFDGVSVPYIPTLVFKFKISADNF